MINFKQCLVGAVLIVLGGCGAVQERPLLVEEHERYLRLGDMNYRKGDLVAAQVAYQQAATYAESIDDHRAIAVSRLNAGQVALLLGDSSSAENEYRLVQGLEVIAIDVSFDYLAELGLAEVATSQGNFDIALGRYNRLLIGAAKMPPRIEAKARNGLALIYLRLGNRSESLAEVNAALVLAQGNGLRREEAAAYANRAHAQLEAGNLAIAKSDAEQALIIDREVRQPVLIANDLTLLGRIAILTNRKNEGLDFYRQARRIYRLAGQVTEQKKLDKLIEVINAGTK